MVETEYPPRCSMRMFEGVRTQYPLFRENGRALYWTIEHHAEVSLGDYEAVKKDKSYYFSSLARLLSFSIRRDKQCSE